MRRKQFHRRGIGRYLLEIDDLGMLGSNHGSRLHLAATDETLRPLLLAGDVVPQDAANLVYDSLERTGIGCLDRLFDRRFKVGSTLAPKVVSHTRKLVKIQSIGHNRLRFRRRGLSHRKRKRVDSHANLGLGDPKDLGNRGQHL